MLSTPEKIALALMIVASLAGFGMRFLPVVRIILAAKPDAGVRFGTLVARIRRFVWEVLLQGKVIKDRPVAGAAHALVFWGFCAFALITINHIATGFGLPVFSRSGGFGMIYFGLAAVFAVAVAVSISYLAFRRYVLRPVWLGKLAPESGFIAALIFVLMVTYLAGLGTAGIRRCGACALVGAYAGAAGLSAVDSAYEASASGAESADGFREARGVQRYSEAGGR